MKLTSYICNNVPFVTTKFCQSCIWTFSVIAWQSQTSLNTLRCFFLWPTSEPKPNLFECFNLHFLILHLKNYGFTNFHTYLFNVTNYRHKDTLLWLLLGASWCHETREKLNSIGHISNTILNWLKQLDNLYIHT